MRATLLQQSGMTQLVLTPENEWEKKALSAIPDRDFEVKRGSFFEECRGGWVREYHNDESLMFCMKKPEKEISTP